MRREFQFDAANAVGMRRQRFIEQAGGSLNVKGDVQLLRRSGKPRQMLGQQGDAAVLGAHGFKQAELGRQRGDETRFPAAFGVFVIGGAVGNDAAAHAVAAAPQPCRLRVGGQFQAADQHVQAA